MSTDLNGEDEHHHAPLHAIMRLLGEELQELGRFTDDIQSVLGPALLRLAGDPTCHRGAQALDLLAQRLAALSGYLLNIGAHMPKEWQVNARHASNAVTLSDLRHRLKGANPPGQEAESGALDLF